MRLLSKVVPLAAVAALALAGCSASDTGSQAVETYPAANINVQDVANLRDSGTLRIAVPVASEQWNKAHVNGNTRETTTVLTPGDVQNMLISDTGEITPNPNFVTEWSEEEKDGKTVITLKLNPQAVWNDGKSIDIEDYVATWKAQNGSNPEFLPAATDGYAQIESVEQGADKFEVVVTFESIYPDWQAPLSTVSHRDSQATPKAFNEAQVAEPNVDWMTGPFKIVKFDKTQLVIEYGRNPSWWGPTAKLDSIIYRVVPAEAEGTTFANGELDYAEAIDSSQYELLKARADAELRGALSPTWRHFTFNSKAGLLQDVELRRAIVKGINRSAIAASDLAGLPVDSEQLLLGNHFFMPGQDGYQDNTGDYAYNPEKAKQELEDLGWKPGADGIREKDGKRLTVKYSKVTGIFTSENEGKLLHAQLKEIGVEVEMVDVAPVDFQAKMAEGAFEIAAFGWVGTPFPMNNITQIYGSGSGSNFAQIDDPAIDELAAKIASTQDRAERVKMANEVDKLIWDNVHTLPLYNRVLFVGVPKNLANYGSFGISSNQPETWGYVKEG